MHAKDFMNVIEMNGTGGAEVLVLGARPCPQPAPHEVLIKIAAAGVNGPDIVQRRGLYPPPESASDLLGLEVSGVIADVGAGVKDWRDGDEVVALTNGGGYAEYVAVHAGHVLPLPKGVDLVDGAGLPETFFTIWSNVFYQQPRVDASATGARILVHGGAGGIGSTAIQLGTALGYEVLATTRDDDNAAWCLELGASRAINVVKEDFVEITRAAGGADVILDIIGGDYVQRNIKAARADARIIQLAFNQGAKMELDLMPLMLKRLTLTGSTLRSRDDDFKTAIAQDLRSELWGLFADGVIKPTTHAVLPLGEASAAHEMMEARPSRHRGKILLKI